MAKSRPLKVTEGTRYIVLTRSGYRCERCHDDFMGKPFSVHHRRPRMMGGSKNPELHKPANLIVLCGSGISGCHGWVESNRSVARDLGFLIMKVESAEEIPFMDITDKWWKIDNEGQKVRFDRKRT